MTKEVKDLYSKNCKILMKETEDSTNKWKNTQCLWTEIIFFFFFFCLFRAVPVAYGSFQPRGLAAAPDP